MVTDEEVRKIALSMPEAEENSHFGHPDFRVRNKIFATLQPEARRSVLKLGQDEMGALIDLDPDTFSASKGFERGGWTRIELARIEAGLLRELMTKAWTTVAPKRLSAEPATPTAKPKGSPTAKPKGSSTAKPKGSPTAKPKGSPTAKKRAAR